MKCWQRLDTPYSLTFWFVASFPGLPHFWFFGVCVQYNTQKREEWQKNCFLVCVQYNTWKRKSGKKLYFAALPLSCIILNANQRTQNGGGLGMRLLLSHMLKMLFSLSKVDGGWFRSKFGKFLSVQLHWDMTNWDMATLAIASALSLHFETYLVPLWVGVEWWAMPLVTVNLVLFKVCHGSLNWKYPRFNSCVSS